MKDLKPEQIQAMIHMLQSMLDADLDATNNTATKTQDNKSLNKSIKTRNKKTVQQQQNINLFDDMQEKAMHQDDILIDKKLSKFPPAVRYRKFQPVDVVCRVCGKKESINPNLLHAESDRYKCNKCSSNSG